MRLNNTGLANLEKQESTGGNKGKMNKGFSGLRSFVARSNFRIDGKKGY